MSRKRAAFSIARSPPIPTMSTRSLDRRVRTWSRAQILFVTDPMAAFAAAEAKLTKALSSVPDHARGHMWLGLVDIWTKRAAQGIAECEHALALDRNLAAAHSAIGFGKIFVGRAEETEAHVAEALRLSPRDTTAYVWMNRRAWRRTTLAVTSKRSRGVDGQSRPIEIIRRHIFIWPPPSRSLVDLTRRIPQSRPVSRSTRPTPSPASALPGRR